MDMMMNLDAPHSMGTTIIGVTYNGGVVLGADSRTSTGVYVANRASDKITQLTDNVYVCCSGSVCFLPPLMLSNRCPNLGRCSSSFTVGCRFPSGFRLCAIFSSSAHVSDWF
ncbi:unnamed protein product [Rhodiola kirilowii]